MRMLRTLSIASLALALAGCQHVGGTAGGDVTYACTQAGAGTPQAAGRRSVTVRDRNDRGVTLVVGGRPEFLSPVADPSGPLYASQRYAWKPDGSSGTFTDVVAIASYACRPVGVPVAWLDRPER